MPSESPSRVGTPNVLFFRVESVFFPFHVLIPSMSRSTATLRCILNASAFFSGTHNVQHVRIQFVLCCGNKHYKTFVSLLFVVAVFVYFSLPERLHVGNPPLVGFSLVTVKKKKHPKYCYVLEKKKKRKENIITSKEPNSPFRAQPNTVESRQQS